MTSFYRIGALTGGIGLPGRIASLKAAADRVRHELVVISDPASCERGAVDFVLSLEDGVNNGQIGAPTFAVVREVRAGFWEDEGWLSRLSTYDGYLTISNSVRRFLHAFFSAEGRAPLVGVFETTPTRQFVTCRLRRLKELEAIRLCCMAAEDNSPPPPLVRELLQWPILRVVAGTGCAPEGEQGLFPSRSLRANHQYAALGAGLVISGDGQAFDVTALGHLCDIASVGAIAICPDVPWIREHFGDSVFYYPNGDPAIAADAVKSTFAEICSDPDAAAQRAAAARQTFETTLCAEVMLQNAIALYEQWRERRMLAAAPNQGGASINTNPAVVAAVFERLSDTALASVARATAALQPLKPHPGWRFDEFIRSPDLSAHVRYAVWLAARARAASSPVIVPWHADTRLKLFLDNDLSLALFAGGAFEPNEFALLNRVLLPGMVFFDGGANEGAYTVFAAARVGPAGHVVAVEPSTREAARLRANIALNRQRNVTVIEAALAETTGAALLRIAEPVHAGQNTLGAFAYEGVSEADMVNVPTVTLDEVVATLELARLDVVKLDIEGAELRALSGSQRALAQMRPLLLIEVLEPALEAQGSSATELFQLLDDVDYVPLIFAESTGEPVPLGVDAAVRSDNIIAVHRERDWGLLTE